MWIQLKSKQLIEVSGKPVSYHPGDWVDVGKQTALLWISQGAAMLPDALSGGFDLSGVGIITDHKELLCSRLKEELKSLDVTEGAPCVPYAKTIILDSTLPFRTSLIPVGVTMLDVWDIAVPLMDYKTLAIHLGDEQERQRTKAVIRDLRVPAYNTALIFVKPTPETERLIDLWRNEGRTALGFLRALYKTKPLILALPSSWTGMAPVVNE